MSSCTQELNGIIGTMPKAQLLCTMVLDPISETILGEVEKDSFAALPVKGGHTAGSMPSKPCVLTWGR